MRFPSRSQRALAEELDSDGEALRKKLSAVVHRTALWRFANGRRRPDHKATDAIHQATGGRVPRDGWLLDEEREEVELALDGTGDDTEAA